MDKETFILLVTRFLSNEATEKEVTALKRYLQDPLYKEHFERIKTKWENESKKLFYRPFSVKKGKKYLFNKLEAQEKINQSRPITTNYKIQSVNLFIKYAAIIVLVIGLGFFLSNSFELENSRTTPVSNVWKEKITLPGEKTELNLHDGTKILLNVSSKIKYPSQFNDTLRTVYIEGEAYFEVAHNPAWPFVVKVDSFETRVLGTSFNISAFPEDKTLAVSLLEGQVAVRNIDQTKQDTLQPMQQYFYDEKLEESVIQPFNSKSIIGWRNNEFVFDNVPLIEVTKVLSRQYGVSIQYENKALEKCQIRAGFNNEPLWAVLDILKYVGEIGNETILVDGKIDKVILKGNGCK